MKKIKLGICAFICALCGLTGCSSEPAQPSNGPKVEITKTASTSTVQTIRISNAHRDTRFEGYNTSEIQIHKVMFEGHEYLMFAERGRLIAWGGITHSGTCPCHKSNNNVQY